MVEDDESLFLPEFDADGNQTRVQTSTGSWAVSYNNENRPTDFTAQDAEGNFTTVHCSYDYMRPHAACSHAPAGHPQGWLLAHRTGA